MRVKNTLEIDAELLRKAEVACRASTDMETIRLGLEALVRHAAYQRLRALIGSETARKMSRKKLRTKRSAAL
jgi:hypothetical protein